MPFVRSLEAYRQSAGNLAVLAVVDSTQPEHAFRFEVALSALAHFGVPFRVHDLATGPLADDALAGCCAALVAQEHLGRRLGSEGLAAVLRAVAGGMGFVNFDSDVDGYGVPLLEAAGLAGAGRDGSVLPDGTSELNVRNDDHAITWMQDGEHRKSLKVPVPTSLVRVVAPDAATLLEDDRGAPMLVARAHGQGRIVQWLASPKLWLRQYLGHTFGLDDVWLRSLTWAARKPFVMKAMPPFFRFRFDDCQGLWRDAQDLRFVDVLNESGHVPSLCFCLRAVTPDGAAKMTALFKSGKAEFAPHTLKPMTSLFYGDESGEYSPARFVELFKEMDETLRRMEIRPSRILSDHDHGWSANAIPGLIARGITYKMNITMPGEPWEAVHRDWHPAPYGSMDYAFDFLPPPADRFFAVYNHYPPAFEYARAYIDEDHFLYHRAGGYGRDKWDMLNGLTRGPAHADNQIETAAQRLADHTRFGLDAGFFGGSITHSHFIRHVSEGEWREILRRADRLMPRHSYESVPYDFIADYARSKAQTAIVRADAADGRVTVDLEGRASVPLRLSVLTDRDGMERRYETVQPFEGRVTMRFAA